MTTTGERVLNALQPYELKQESPTEYRCNSPFRPGANSHSFKLTISADGEHGGFYDHVGDDRGSLYECADRLHVERPKSERVEVETTKRAYRSLEDYAELHGIEATVLRAAGWEDVVTYQNRRALPFKTANGLRFRFIDGEKPYYKPEQTGYKSCWYGLRTAIAMTEDSWQPLVLCNGEVSTVVAQHYGVAACCVTSGEKVIPADQLAELRTKYQGAILLAYDCDDKGRKTAADVRAQLAGYKVDILDLGLGDAGDLADFCKLHRHEAKVALLTRVEAAPDVPAPALSVRDPLETLAEAANALKAEIRKDEKSRKLADLEIVLSMMQAELDRVRMSNASPILKSFGDLVSENLVMLDFMRKNPDPIRGLRSHIGSLDKAIGGFTPETYVIYGAPSMGKSTLSVSFAREFVKQGPGLIVPTESNPNRWMTKLVASICKIPSDKIETGMLSEEEYENVKAVYRLLKDHYCHMLQGGSPTPGMVRAAVLKGVKEWGYKWLIIDSASKMNYPGASNIYDITRGVSNEIQSLMQEADIPIIMTSQIGRDVADKPAGQKMPQLEDGYGGGTIEQNAGVVIGLYNHAYYVEVGKEEPNPEFPSNTALARILKNRWNPGARINGVMLAFVGGSGFYELERNMVNFNDI